MKSCFSLAALLVMLVSNTHSTSAKDGVILLHGLSRSAASMAKMERFLEGHGFEVLNVDYPSTSDTIETLADATIAEALESERLRSCSKIHFVTHSMGGILVRSYFARKSDPRLGRVVMLGPPNQGSEVVDRIGGWRLFGWLNGSAGRELGTADDSTPNSLGPVAFELGVIAGDRSINWINSAMIRGSNDGKVSVERTKVDGMQAHLVAHATHPLMMNNKKVMTQTLRFLQTGSFKTD